MTGPLAHVGGMPVEEALLAFAPVAAIWIGVARATLHRRRRAKPHRTRDLRERRAAASASPPPPAEGPR